MLRHKDLYSIKSSLKLMSWRKQSQYFSQQTFVLQGMSWRRLQHVFSVTILRLPMTSWKTKNCYVQDVSKTSWRHILKTSWRNYGDKTKYLLGKSASNKSKCVSNKSVFYKSIFENSQVNPKWITHQFNIFFILELKQHLYFKN